MKRVFIKKSYLSKFHRFPEMNCCWIKTLNVITSICLLLIVNNLISGQPISICPNNPHYYFYNNKPVILITSAEHYGAVVNKDFNYISYLNTLKSYNLNYTRIYPGYLFEPKDKFIKGNTLAPKPESLLLPWARSTIPGYALGGNKFDLDKWDEFYFQRLRNFIKTAGEKGIIVEICFYNAQYDDTWPISALYFKNNIQRIGNCHWNDAQTLKDTALVRRESDYVRKIVQEVNQYDNLILEICDETTVNGTPLNLAGEWTRYMINVIKDTEQELPKKHLIAQQVLGPLGGPCDFSGDNSVSVIVGQYVGIQYYGDGRATLYDAVQEGGIQALDDKYPYNKPIELNETNYYPLWYKNDAIADSRVEAWEFIVGGGAGFNHLNGRFTVEQPDGNTPDDNRILSSLKNLTDFINGFDFTLMKPDKQVVINDSLKEYVFYRVMSQPGKQYAIYLHHSFLEYSVYTVIPGKYLTTLDLRIPKGEYKIDWVNPETGLIGKTEVIIHNAEVLKLTSPGYTVDIALRILQVDKH